MVMDPPRPRVRGSWRSSAGWENPPEDHGGVGLVEEADAVCAGGAQQHGWLGEVENLHVSLIAAENKLAQFEERICKAATVNLGIPTFREIAGRTTTLPVRSRT
jgi:hypothetical protein